MTYDLYPAVDQDFQFPPEIREALRKSVELRNMVLPMTQAARNNLLGEDLWDGRMIFNFTTKRINRYDAELSAWTPLSTEPPGVVKAYEGTTAPDAHAMCDGTVVPRTGIYAALFAVVGTRHNTGGEAATDFRLPNYKGRTLVGQDPADTAFDTLGEKGGAKRVTLDTTQIPSHNHGGATGNDSPDHGHSMPGHVFQWGQNNGIYVQNAIAAAGAPPSNNLTTAQNAWTITYGANARHAHSISSQGGGQSHENMPPYAVTNYIITL